jgi:hypothetical protein
MNKIKPETNREIDLSDQYYKSGYNSGADHNTHASEETKNLFKNMDEKVQKIEIVLTKHGENIDFIKSTVSKLENSMDEFIRCADNKYAPMWTADSIKFIIAGIITLFLGGLGIMLFKQ